MVANEMKASNAAAAREKRRSAAAEDVSHSVIQLVATSVVLVVDSTDWFQSPPSVLKYLIN